MDRRDKRLLDKQLWGIDPYPPSIIALGFATVFIGGIFIGSVLFGHEHKQSQVDMTDVTGSISPRKPFSQIPDRNYRVLPTSK